MPARSGCRVGLAPPSESSRLFSLIPALENNRHVTLSERVRERVERSPPVRKGAAREGPLRFFGRSFDSLADSFAQDDMRVGVVIPHLGAAKRRSGAQNDMHFRYR